MNKEVITVDLFSLFSDFYSVAIVNKYPANVRGVYDSILYDFNARFYPEHCIYTQRELSALTGLSLEPLHRALKFLAERGHITVRTSKKGTVIRLPNTNQTQPKQKPNTTQTQGESVGLVPYTPRAQIEVNEAILTEKRESKNEDEARARVSEMNAYELWEFEIGFALQGSIAYELESLEKTYGRESFHTALLKTAEAKPKKAFPYFKKVLENLNKPETTSEKGGEDVETAFSSYTNTTRTGREPWNNY